MDRLRNIVWSLMIAVVLISTYSCQQPDGNNPGSEYMPDMAHSIAYEANTYAYYYNNTWGSKEDYHEMAQPREPVKGTIARGAVSDTDMSAANNAITVPANGATPYYYDNTEEERTRATMEIIDSPYKITDKGLAQGENLYNIFCGICHGGDGGGQGYLVREPNPAAGDDGGKYPVQPANFLLDEFINASNGRYYHAIHYGKNLMGSYKDKLSYEERWQVIHYIRKLQAKHLKVTYDQYTNELNDIEIPAGDIITVANNQVMELGDSNHEYEDHNSALHDENDGVDHKDFKGEQKKDDENHGGDH